MNDGKLGNYTMDYDDHGKKHGRHAVMTKFRHDDGTIVARPCHGGNVLPTRDTTRCRKYNAKAHLYKHSAVYT